MADSSPKRSREEEEQEKQEEDKEEEQPQTEELQKENEGDDEAEESGDDNGSDCESDDSWTSYNSCMSWKTQRDVVRQLQAEMHFERNRARRFIQESNNLEKELAAVKAENAALKKELEVLKSCGDKAYVYDQWR